MYPDQHVILHQFLTHGGIAVGVEGVRRQARHGGVRGQRQRIATTARQHRGAFDQRVDLAHVQRGIGVVRVVVDQLGGVGIADQHRLNAGRRLRRVCAIAYAGGGRGDSCAQTQIAGAGGFNAVEEFHLGTGIRLMQQHEFGIQLRAAITQVEAAVIEQPTIGNGGK